MYNVKIRVVIEDESVVLADSKAEALRIVQEEYLNEPVALKDLAPEFIMYDVEELCTRNESK